MYNNISNVRNIELPDNLFSNLGEISYNKPQKENYNEQVPEQVLEHNYVPEYNNIPNVETPMNNYMPDNIPEPKLVNLSNKSQYRERMDNIYNEINDIEPIDNEINNTLYTKNYNEKGIVIKPKASSLKQLWTEFRLISNEKNKGEKIETNKTDFDELFSQLSIRVKEINEYIDELKEMRTSIEETNIRLSSEKEKFEEEKRNFMSYKLEEEEKITKEKESIKVEKANIEKNYNRLQNIIDDLNNKINSID